MYNSVENIDAPFQQYGEELHGWKRYALRLAVNAVLYPLEYSKTLIQLGYEPIKPRLGRNIFGKPVLILPNIFEYTSYIRKVDGIIGCYRGLSPKLIGSIVSMLATEKLVRKYNLEPIDDEALSNKPLTDEELYCQFLYNLKRDVVLNVSGIIVSQPFRVISIRMMAQFIGRECHYQTILGSIAEIWRTEGIRGFFAGLIPELLCEAACLILSSVSVYIVSKYFTKDTVIRQYSNGFAQFIFSNILYPFRVISACMTVSGAHLIAGKPPIMPLYSDWLHCYNDLHARNQLKRGSSIIWRYTAVLPTLKIMPMSYEDSF